MQMHIFPEGEFRDENGYSPIHTHTHFSMLLHYSEGMRALEMAAGAGCCLLVATVI